MSVPMLVLFLRSPIYTRIFSPEFFGKYALVNITYTYLSSVTYSWVVNTSSRYFNKYKKRNQLHIYSSLQTLFISIIILVFIGTAIIWSLFSNDLLFRRLILFGSLHFIFQETLNYLSLFLRLNKKAKLNNNIRIISALVSFAILLLLTFIYDLQIDAFYLSTIAVNLILIAYCIFRKHFKLNFRFREIPSGHIGRYLKFGLTTLATNIGIVLIMSSDRYLIKYFGNLSEVGIYNQVYNLAQMIILSMITVYQTSVNPHLLELFDKEPANYRKFLPKYIYLASYLYVLASLLIGLFPKEIILLLGEEFREGWTIIPYVVVSNLIYGLCYFLLLIHKFQSNFRILITGSLLAAIINIALNIYAIQHFGYQAAAITTFVAYGTLFIFYYLKSGLSIKDLKPMKTAFGRLIISVVVIVTVTFIVDNIFEDILYLKIITKLLTLVVGYFSLNGFKNLKASLVIS